MKILLVSRFNEARYAHAALYQRALERLGATVTPFNLERTGWLDRLTRKDLKVRLEQAIRHADPDIILITDGEVIREGAVEPLKWYIQEVTARSPLRIEWSNPIGAESLRRQASLACRREFTR